MREDWLSVKGLLSMCCSRRRWFPSFVASIMLSTAEYTLVFTSYSSCASTPGPVSMSSLYTNGCAVLPVLCERVCGRALPLFLATGALRELLTTIGLGSGRRWSVCCVLPVGADVMRRLSIRTEWRACCNCWESCENVYFRIFACSVYLR